MPDSASSTYAAPDLEKASQPVEKRPRQGSGSRTYANFRSAISTLRIQRRYTFQAIASTFSAATIVMALYILQYHTNTLLHHHVNVRVRLLLMAGIGAVSFATGGLIMGKVLLKVGRKRTREFGIGLVIGARHCDIRNQLLFEALFLNVAGGVLGNACGLCIGFAVIALLQLPFIVDPMLLLLLVGVSIVPGLLCSFYAIRKILRMDFENALC
ncbi:MAG: FtsX-like permease family protein [Ktedonobacteraceae bacterium]|nr:FtsX-like permease family protein [Ktedonobacteraceae bacterium]